MGQNLRGQKIHLPPCAFLVSRHGIFKVHLSQCVFGVLAMCPVWIFLVHFRCNLCVKAHFFTLLVPVSRPGAFFYALGTSVLCRCMFLRLCENRTCTFTAGVFSYPRVVHFFWQAHFWTAAVETRPAFWLQVYFGSICFLKIKRTFICFKIVRVSTRFGELKLTPLLQITV